MPFTFAHPAIVLPFGLLKNSRLSMTGLIVGSLSPDFEYFLRLRLSNSIGHSLLGLFVFCIPIGLCFAIIYHKYIKLNLINNLPIFLKSRLFKYTKDDWPAYLKNNLLLVTLSLFIGACSHLFWDGFTHPDGLFVNLIPVLSTKIQIFAYEIPILKLLQHTSTLLGFLGIIYAIKILPKDENVDTQIDSKYYISILIITLLFILLRVFTGLSLTSPGNLIVNIITAFLLGLVLTPLVLRVVFKSS